MRYRSCTALLLLHAAFRSSPVDAVARQLLLIKTHKPTEVMLARWCRHFSQPEEAWRHGFTVAVMFYSSGGDTGLGDGVVTIPSDWCMPFEVVRKHNLTALWGEEQALALTSQPWVWSSTPDLSYFALHRAAFPYDSMWVLEQDVAWSGNIFKLLGQLGSGREEDLLCADVNYGRVGKKHWWQLHNDKWMWYKTHTHWSGWDDSPGAPRIRCSIMAVRYSTRLLRRLVDDYLNKAIYAHGEFFASTVCGLMLDNCTVGDYVADGAPLGRPFSCCFDTITGSKEWIQARARFPGTLMHPVKV
jgi:hypothetical protein